MKVAAVAVEEVDLVLFQVRDEVRADEAGGAGDEDPHAFALSKGRKNVNANMKDAKTDRNS